MSPALEIGLPELSEEELESLTEDCESEITNYILERISKKSIAEMSVSCMLTYESSELSVEFLIDVSQDYATGQSLDDIIADAGEFGLKWLEQRLQEMKDD